MELYLYSLMAWHIMSIETTGITLSLCYVVLFLQKLKLMLLKKDDSKTNSLMSHLRKINEHLGRKGTRFLTGDTMCCFDCELMPRLQHIRVAGDFPLIVLFRR